MTTARPVVLLVDDDADIRTVTRAALLRAGFAVEPVGSGEEALVAVRRSRPDVVLLDWMMPGLDGLDTYRRLRTDPATAKIPVVFLTAASHTDAVQRGLSLGAAGCITKPFDALSLGDTLRRLLGWTTDEPVPREAVGSSS